MEKDFTPYDRALRLKALGFNEPCFGWYENNELVTLFDCINPEDRIEFIKVGQTSKRITAPTFSQVFRWFRDKGYDVKVQKESAGLYFGFYWTGAAWIIVGNGSFEEAELACLDKLIELVELKVEKI